MTTNVGGVPDQPQSEHETDQVSQNQKKEQGAKRKRMKERSEVWEHFDKEDLPSGMQAICKYCGMSYKCGAKKNGTSVLWAHISRCRKYPFNTPKDSKQSLLSFKSAKEPSGGTSGLTYHKFDAGSIRKALSFMVIVDELPFKFVEGIGFRHFCGVIEPRFNVPSRITVAKDCFETYLTEKRKLKNVLKRCNSRVSLTTDTWTSIQQINYMCLTVHFIDNNWKLHKRILNFCPISSHKGDDIGKEIEKCLLDWGLENVMCITVDNASSNDTAIGYMRRKINGWKTGVLKGRFLHMRCVAHIVNLVVSDGLKTVNESVQRVRHAVRFIKQSPARLQRFKKCVLDEKINTKKGLCLDVPTRWNSTYLMLNAAIELQDAFERYSGEDPHYVVDLNERDGKGSPDSDDWNNVRRLSEFLQAFYDLTLHVSGSLYVSLNLFFHELVSVAVLMKDLVSSDDVDMCLMACRMKEKYEKYWGDPEKINLLIFIAIVLDPRYKLDYVEWMITEIYDPIVASKLVDNVKVALNALYEEYRVSSSNDVNREEVSSSKDGKTPLSPKHKKIEVLKSKYKKHKCERDGDAKIELDKYLEEDTAEDIDEFDILSWWKFNCSSFNFSTLLLIFVTLIMDFGSITECLANKTILITGATGFIAKILLEKILRVQPNLNKLYLLIRASDAQALKARVQDEVLGKELFKVLREKWGSSFESFVSEKISAVAGDTSYENLGLTDDQVKEMYDDIDIVINVAATTRFDERYDIALGVNTLGPKHVINFAKNCTNIKLLIHVSTAYVCGEKAGIISEKAHVMGEALNGMVGLDIENEKKIVAETLSNLKANDVPEKAIRQTMKNLGSQRTIDSIAVMYGKGYLSLFSGDGSSVLDLALILASRMGGSSLQRNLLNFDKELKIAMRLVELYKPYVFFKGIFADTNTEKLLITARKNGLDEEAFNFDPLSVNWKDYFFNIHLPSIVKSLF
uniref:BED-type domain-containing protein n=1 Tax=Chenopodium quinoa TaxID=63459 RepID=A0A803MKL1_CHEQI